MSGQSKKLYGTATVGSKGQIVIPAEAREDFTIVPGDKLYIIGSCDGGWIGAIKEDQLRELIDKMTENTEIIKEALDAKGVEK